jgi:hypothetical protein
VTKEARKFEIDIAGSLHAEGTLNNTPVLKWWRKGKFLDWLEWDKEIVFGNIVLDKKFFTENVNTVAFRVIVPSMISSRVNNMKETIQGIGICKQF